jgi:hypothetical protein
MTKHSYPLLVVDHQGVEHAREATGHNEGDAARRLGRADKRVVCILSGNRKPRSQTHTPQAIWHRKGRQGIEDMNTSVPDTLMGQEIMHARLHTANLLLKSLENRGIRLILKHEDKGDGIVEYVIDVKPAIKATDADLRDVEENKESLIARLQEIAAQKAITEPPNPEKPTRKAKKAAKQPYRALLEELLPQFTQKHILLYEIEQKLHKVGQHALADNSKALRQLLADITFSGGLEIVKEDVYRLPGQGALDIDAKGPSQEPTETAATPVAAPEATKEKTPVVTHSPMNGLNPMDLIVGLSSALVAAPLEADEAQTVEVALSTCVSEMMNSVEKLEGALRPVIERLRAQSKARRYLREQFSAPAN